ncbi:uncharacterized protein LOC5512989 isoform X2 [Nematostella vectensis]|uniref:uncharacterized protein LOC5512989 isoform X2 n=1 Tax=Nematostella vectensis TaxID=45351 RepID=UPI0013904802|nr:uncharacterized protein LOC5512989 isoform X2 [Nematostella vectensis]
MGEIEIAQSLRIQHKIDRLRKQDIQLQDIELVLQREKERLLNEYRLVYLDHPQWKREKTFHASGGNRQDAVLELLREIHQQKKEKQILICQTAEKRSKKEIVEIKNAIHDNTGNNKSILSQWYTYMSSKPQGKQLCIEDSLFYNISYQNRGNNEVKNTLTDNFTPRASLFVSHHHPWLTGDRQEMLSFSTRHCGVCVYVLITRTVRTEDTDRNQQTEHNSTKQVYMIQTDPQVASIEKRGRTYIQSSRNPEELIRDLIWTFIDSVVALE